MLDYSESMESIVGGPANGQPITDGKNLVRRAAVRGRRALTGPCSLWDMAPRKADLADLPAYRETVALHRHLYGTDYSMTSSRRARTLARASRTVTGEGVAGAIVDCGVWNGGSTIILGTNAPDREVWAFDSFEGLPAPSQVDGEKSFDHVGDCLGSEDMLRRGFAATNDPARLHVVKGWFDQTFPAAAAEIGPIAVLHADGDWYDSVKLTLETFYDQISPGGFVVIDDYGHWIGAKKATDEFRAAIGEVAPLQAADYSGRYWRKPRS